MDQKYMMSALELNKRINIAKKVKEQMEIEK